MSHSGARNEPLILLVEDREDDILLIQKAFARAKIPTLLEVVRDGEEAIAYLSGSGKYSDRHECPLPWLMLLDLKMPRVDGFEVLKWVRQQKELSSLVVVVLTSSDQLRDVNKAYQMGANSFMVKPLDFNNATALAELLNQYWLQHNRFPETGRQPARETNHARSG